MIPARARRSSLLLATLVVVGLSFLNPSSASAAPAPAGAAAAADRSVPDGPVPATVIGGAHRCQTFGAVVAGYVAAHCADLDQFDNSAGDAAIRGLGQAFCQRASDHVNVRCAGIVQLTTVTELYTGVTRTSGNRTCGSYGGTACPTTATFRNYSAGLYRLCGNAYVTTVRTTILLPNSVGTSRSSDFNSAVALTPATC